MQSRDTPIDTAQSPRPVRGETGKPVDKSELVQNGPARDPTRTDIPERLINRLLTSQPPEDFTDAGKKDSIPLQAQPGVHRLVLKGSAGEEFHLSLEKTSWLVGRKGQQLDVALGDASVSSRHARLHFEKSGLFVEDLNSTNGTWLNEMRVSARTRVSSGDCLHFGHVPLVFTHEVLEPIQETTRYEGHSLSDGLGHSRSPRRNSEAGSVHDSSVPAATEEDVNAIDWIDYVSMALDILRRYGVLVVFLTGLGLALGMWGGSRLTPGGSAFLEIKLSRKAKLNPVESNKSLEFFVSAEKSFKAIPLVQSTLTELGWRHELNVAHGVANRLKFEPLDQAKLVWKAEFQDSNGSRAYAFLTRHLDNYLAAELDKNVYGLRANIRLLERQLLKVTEDIAQTSGRLADLKIEFPGISVGAGTAQFRNLGIFSKSRDVLRARVQRLSLEVKVMKKRLKNGDVDAKLQVNLGQSFDKTIQGLVTKLAAARAQGLRDEHPEVARLLKEQRRLAQEKSLRMKTSPSGLEIKANDIARASRDTLKQLEVELSVAQTELQQMEERLGTAEVIMTGLPAAEAEFDRLVRSESAFQQVQGKIFQRLQADRLQLQIELESARSRYELIIPPTPEWGSQNANIVKFGIAGAFLMGLLAVFSVALREGLSFARRKVNEALKEKALRAQQVKEKDNQSVIPSTAINPSQMLRDSG